MSPSGERSPRRHHRHRHRLVARRRPRSQLGAHGRRPVRPASGDAVRRVGVPQPDRRRDRHVRPPGALHAVPAPPLVAERAARRRGRDRGASTTPASSTASSIAPGSASCSAPGPATCCATRSTTSSCSPKASTAPGRPGSTTTSRTRRSTCWRSTSTCRARASCVVAACSSSTIAIGQAADLILDGELDAADLRRHRRAGAAHVQRFQRAAPHGSGAVQAVRQGAAGDEHRRGRGDAGARGHGAGEGPRRDDLRRAGRLRAVLRGVSRDRARSPRAVPSAGRSPARSRAPAWPRTRSTTSTATARRRRRTIAPRPAACTWSSATAPGASRSTRSSRWSATAWGPPAPSRPPCSALTVKRGVIPPTIHHDTTDPECDVDVVANTAREVPVRCGVSTSLAFGGNDAALVMRAV